ncbi:MAG TPA: 6-phospho-5-dehydro-2-deoxy-D-gluconate aldolase, partial [Facklamia tabacinasalis]|nr:6-phospho-5-dehydro-2-deoxy-D-gluconate aldolase [Ruoffia tabacinasalis]
TKAVREKLNTDDKVYDPRKVIAPGKDAIVATTKETMDMFGSSNKA